MKNIFLLLLFIMSFYCNVHSQELKIFNNNGEIGITSTDDKGYVVVNVEGSSSELYEKIRLYVNELMVNPDFSIVGDQNGKYLKWRTHTKLNGKYKYSMEYLTSVSFKDNKIKVEYYLQEIKNHYTMNDTWLDVKYNSSYTSIYKKNGKGFTKFGELKSIIETYFNTILSELESSLNEENNEDW